MKGAGFESEARA